jgi:hypothetical protein
MRKEQVMQALPGSRIRRGAVATLVFASAAFFAAFAFASHAGPPALAAGETLYPQVLDASHATPEAVAFFTSFFTAKSRHGVAATMSHFSPQVVTYTDATLGWALGGHDAIRGIFAEYMPKWPPSGLSYPTRILGDADSALVAFTDTPELFGGELRILGAVDLAGGKVVRWVDYWDASGFDAKLYAAMRTPPESFPTDFREGAVRRRGAARIDDVATRLQRALAAGDAAAAAALFSSDGVYEDLALRAQLLGRAAIERYLARVLPQAPFGRGAALRHVVGGDLGGGFEWVAPQSAGVDAGITALELDGEGRISRLTTVYDGRQLAPEARRALALLALEG